MKWAIIVPAALLVLDAAYIFIWDYQNTDKNWAKPLAEGRLNGK